ncbi:hypothetical protein VNI00_006915 [Paramarasmius palmivorus]|uniref:F-box domain-containing protein n=1 Tax=Paramarasmius palmivorus TaxID=297713 RepID=A0AAW0D8B7_9AGAR
MTNATEDEGVATFRSLLKANSHSTTPSLDNPTPAVISSPSHSQAEDQKSRLQVAYPAELVCAIFKNLQHSSKDLLVASWVCRMWRSVALGDPSLWAAPNLKSPGLTRLFLTRANTSPLNLVLWEEDAHHKVDRTFVESLSSTLSSHLKQTASLDLALVPETIHLLDQVAQGVTPPLLRKLRFSCAHRKNEESHGSCRVRHLDFPSVFFGGLSPGLTKLEVRLPLVSAHWPSAIRPLVKTLKYLAIKHCLQSDNIQSAFRLPLARFLPLLEEAQQLEELLLHGVVPTRGAEPPPTQVSLRQLLKMDLSNASSVECADLIQQLVMPNLISFKADCFQTALDWCDDGTGERISGLLFLLGRVPRQLTDEPDVPSTHLEITFNRKPWLGLWYREMSLRAKGPRSIHPTVSLTVGWIENAEQVGLADLATFLKGVLSYFDWSSLSHLTMKTNGRYASLNDLVDIAQRFSRITDLVVAGSCVPVFLRLMGPGTREEPFPLLERLALDDIDAVSPNCKNQLLLMLYHRACTTGRLQSVTFGPKCIRYCDDSEWLDDLQAHLECGVSIKKGDHATI